MLRRWENKACDWGDAGSDGTRSPKKGNVRSGRDRVSVACGTGNTGYIKIKTWLETGVFGCADCGGGGGYSGSLDQVVEEVCRSRRSWRSSLLERERSCHGCSFKWFYAAKDGLEGGH